jgi:hypothetical protein
MSVRMRHEVVSDASANVPGFVLLIGTVAARPDISRGPLDRLAPARLPGCVVNGCWILPVVWCFVRLRG